MNSGQNPDNPFGAGETSGALTPPMIASWGPGSTGSARRLTRSAGPCSVSR
jgi:hypothetical protein